MSLVPAFRCYKRTVKRVCAIFEPGARILCWPPCAWPCATMVRPSTGAQGGCQVVEQGGWNGAEEMGNGWAPGQPGPRRGVKTGIG